MFEFREALPALFEGGKKDAPVEAGPTWEECGDLFQESREHVGDDSEIPEPCALRPLLQGLRLPGFLLCAKRFDEQGGLVDHILPLPAVRLMVVAQEPGHLPRGERRFGEIFRKQLSVLGYCARNRDDHPRCGPGRDRPLSNEIHEVFGQGVIKRQPPGDPSLRASHHGGDPSLGELVVIVKLPHEGRLLEEIPLSTMGTGEDLHEGLFFRTVPYLRHDRVAPTVYERLYPQVAVEQHHCPGDDHGDDLPDALDGGGERKALFGAIYPRVGIAKVELPDPDLFNLPKMPVHGHPIHLRKSLPGRRRSGP